MHYSPQTFHPPAKSKKAIHKPFFEPKSTAVSVRENKEKASQKPHALDLGKVETAEAPQEEFLQKSDDSHYFTGTVIIGEGCRLEDFKMIPGLDNEPLYTPTSRVITHIDGFWYRQMSDSWFKIPNGATVSVECDESRRLSYEVIVNVPFFSPEWVRGSGYPF
ncbi:hypothetical protein QWY93_15935 [Echinicola jeungdonensis]|uniref:Uncharacterized protein n=1 Tax=Echinicola jeungdonensis TaxID=709343 RepID=A0ABV5J6V5_9BACT|nr:hypothetical protein [Echinicola jeungdonensis]MDN3670811.1 hypothetical protein [Echinicola jeungdonensis]